MEEEYEEQREELVELMRQLKNSKDRCDHKYAYMYPASLI